MSAYHQMGHQSQNLLTTEYLDTLYRGAILSPTNYSEDETRKQIEMVEKKPFETIFDPQLYYPASQQGKLPLWSYYPSDVETADQTDIRWWHNVVCELAAAVKRIAPSTVCSPALVPRSYADEYYSSMLAIANNLRGELADTSTAVLQTLIVPLSDLAQPTRGKQIASIISKPESDRVFLVLLADLPSRRELSDTEDIKRVMRLIRDLEQAGIRVLVGFSSSDIILWKTAGATDCSTGKFWNLRRFDPQRWEPPTAGGGQISFWFEEAMMAFLTESDLIRVQNYDLLSGASRSNPFGNEILHQINSEPGKAWLGLSWRQFMYWFADFEQRFSNGDIVPDPFLENAEHVWDILGDNNVLMEDRRNDGAWLRSWRRAVLEFDSDTNS